MKQTTSFLVCGWIIAAAQLVSAQTVFNTLPSRTVGQPSLQQSGAITEVAPNLVEGRELFFPEAVAIDNSATPPIVYVADTLNNRVLAWKNSSGFHTGDPADLVIGQRDLFTTFAKGPGTDLSTGLSAPSGLVVDSGGNLYVADSGNNRIVRYPVPFQQTSQILPIDMILGQKDLNSRGANQSSPTGASAITLSLTNQLIGMVFDSSGNLWVSDGGNNRVLRYAASSLPASQGFDPAANLVLGQPDFVTTSIPSGFNQGTKGTLNQPGALAFSPEGQLFVGDSSNRVLVYVPPFANGQSAARIIGARLQNAPPVSDNTIGAANGIFFVGDNPFIVDTLYSRILQYDPFSQWPPESTALSPTARKVFGQPDFVSSTANAGQAQPTDISFSQPTGAVILGTDLYLADSGNHRVLDIPQVNSLFLHASRVLGQVDFKYNSLNLIEGREFDFADTIHQTAGGSVAVDTVSTVPHLYVADVFNNRILGFKDSRNVQSGQKADLVIGQPDFYTAVRNYPGGTAQSLNASNLSFPEGVAVDANGDVWVADTSNSRVLRFPKPFDQPGGGMPQANLVIGQTNFFSKITDASSQTMSAPWGIAFTTAGHLVVSDSALNRVLFFRKPAAGDFTIGQSANNVIGEPDFITTSINELHSPRGIATDPSDRLYVADALNSRILVYPNVTVAGNDPAPSFFLSGAKAGDHFTNPVSVAVDKTTGEVWVADSFANPGRVVRFPSYDLLITNQASNLTFVDSGPISVALDANGNPIIAESSANRVAFYYRAVGSNGNAANYFARYSPGMLATVKPSANSTFGTATVTNSQIPVPTTLGDVQVLVNGVASPIIYASPSQINFQIPSTTPTGSSPVEIDVIRASTGQVLSAGEFRIDPYSPGLFTLDATGAGALIAQNLDGSLNSAAHPAKAGSTITFYGTGEGVISGAPPDGTPPTTALSTAITPRVIVNGFDAQVQYSGVAPGFIGLWQINVVVPAGVPPGTVNVAIELSGVISTLDPNNVRIFTTIVTAP